MPTRRRSRRKQMVAVVAGADAGAGRGRGDAGWPSSWATGGGAVRSVELTAGGPVPAARRPAVPAAAGAAADAGRPRAGAAAAGRAGGRPEPARHPASRGGARPVGAARCWIKPGRGAGRHAGDGVRAAASPSFSWQALLRGQPPTRRGPAPVAAHRPGARFRRAAARARGGGRGAPGGRRRRRSGPQDGATLRLTGQAPVNDEQFATLSNGAALNGVGTAAAVLLILWLALRSGRIVAGGGAERWWPAWRSRRRPGCWWWARST